jgi:hypothetical protein
MYETMTRTTTHAASGLQTTSLPVTAYQLLCAALFLAGTVLVRGCLIEVFVCVYVVRCVVCGEWCAVCVYVSVWCIGGLFFNCKYM